MADRASGPPPSGTWRSATAGQRSSTKLRTTVSGVSPVTYGRATPSPKPSVPASSWTRTTTESDQRRSLALCRKVSTNGIPRA